MTQYILRVPLYHRDYELHRRVYLGLSTHNVLDERHEGVIFEYFQVQYLTEDLSGRRVAHSQSDVLLQDLSELLIDMIE